MAVVFFDTSALIRRYDPSESGALMVRQLCRPVTGHVLLITRIAPVEVASALNRKLREGALDEPKRDQAWRIFRRHWREQYRVIVPDEPTFQLAAELLFTERLRAFDALHIAASLQARALMANVVRDFRFCTADQRQATAATNSGLLVEFVS